RRSRRRAFGSAGSSRSGTGTGWTTPPRTAPPRIHTSLRGSHEPPELRTTRPSLGSRLVHREADRLLERHGVTLVPRAPGHLRIEVPAGLVRGVALEDPRDPAGRAAHLLLHPLRSRSESDRLLMAALPRREEREVAEHDADA